MRVGSEVERRRVCIQKVGGVPLLDRPNVDALASLGTASAGQAVPSASQTSVVPDRSSGTPTHFSTNFRDAHTSKADCFGRTIRAIDSVLSCVHVLQVLSKMRRRTKLSSGCVPRVRGTRTKVDGRRAVSTGMHDPGSRVVRPDDRSWGLSVDRPAPLLEQASRWCRLHRPASRTQRGPGRMCISAFLFPPS